MKSQYVGCNLTISRSPPSREVWIEIQVLARTIFSIRVTSLAGGVD